MADQRANLLPIVAQAAQQHGVPEDLLQRLVQTESGFDDSHYVSSAGALGPAQLMPGTAKELGVDPNDPVQNIHGGAKYLRQMFDKFGDWPTAVAAYNAGPGAVLKAAGDFTKLPAETQAYVPKVLGIDLGPSPVAPSQPAKGPPGVFMDTAGTLTQLPPEIAADAASLGYTPASPQQIADFNAQLAKHEKYGTPAGGVEAGLLGLARGLTGGWSSGLSDVAAHALGMSTEDIEGLKQEWPTLSGASTAAGLLAGLAAPVLKGASVPGLIGKLGGAAKAGVAEALPEASSALGRIVARGLAAGAGSAIEASAFTGSNLVSEMALGDPHVSAQSLLADVGLAGALGLVGGAAGSGVFNLAKTVGLPVVDKLQTALKGLPISPARLLGLAGIHGEAARLGIEAVREFGPEIRQALAHLPPVEGLPEALGTAGAAGVAAGVSPEPQAFAEGGEVQPAPEELLKDASADGALRDLVDKSAAGVQADRVAQAIGARPSGVESTSFPILQDPAKVAVLAHIERTQAAVANRIDQAASAAVHGTEDLGIDGGGSFTDRVDALRRLTVNPEAMLRLLNDQTADWSHHAPSIAAAMSQATARAVAFLASRIPQVPSAPFDPPQPPSDAEQARFGRYWEAVDDPVRVLKQAGSGTLTPEAVEAARTVYPDLYGKMQAALMSKLTEASSVPYQRRETIGAILGTDLGGPSGSSGAAGMLRAMGAYASSQQSQPRQPVRAAPRKDDRLTLASRSRTDVDQAAARSQDREQG